MIQYQNTVSNLYGARCQWENWGANFSTTITQKEYMLVFCGASLQQSDLIQILKNTRQHWWQNA